MNTKRAAMTETAKGEGCAQGDADKPLSADDVIEPEPEPTTAELALDALIDAAFEYVREHSSYYLEAAGKEYDIKRGVAALKSLLRAAIAYAKAQEEDEE